MKNQKLIKEYFFDLDKKSHKPPNRFRKPT